MRASVGNVLIKEHEIAIRIESMGAEVSRDYAGRDLLAIGVLKGSAFFATDLVRRIDNPLMEMDWTTVSSYGAGTKSSGVVRMLAETAIPVAGRNVLILDDICDSGLTLTWMVRHLLGKGANSVEAAVLIRKPASVTQNVDVNYVGFDLGNDYVVGYGMDLNQRFRQLRDIHSLSVEGPA